ncbi:MAG: phosphotransferase family protein [Gammaproteobacteria bacterium]|nr:phosphotransferase family protein [Gammaproteobacteria bacterium]
MPEVPDNGAPTDAGAPRRDVVLRALAREQRERGGLPAPDRIEVVPLSGGSARRSYLATAEQSPERRAWVVRTPADGASGALDVAGECAVTRAAGERGLTPRVVGCDEEAGLLITDYRAGAEALTPEAARRPDNVRRIAQLLKALHGLRVPLRSFAPREFAALYIADLGGRGSLRRNDRPLVDALAVLADAYCARHPGDALCHNDLAASNILEDGRLWLVDFEYAAAAAPILDLANLAAMNDYGSDLRRELTEAYFTGAPAPFDRNDFDDAVRMVRLLGYFWALARARHVEDPGPYARFAEQLAAALK